MISVMVVAPDDLVGHQLAQALGGEATTVVAVALSSTTALRRLADDVTADVVVVDDRVAPVPVWQFVRTVGAKHPGTAVVVTVADAGAEAYAEAMDAGARGVVARPVAVEDLLGRVSAAGAWSAGVRRLATEASVAGQRTARTGSTVVLAGAKGGVGTTTLAVHLALAASLAGRSTVLVDLDLAKGDVAALMDITHQRDVTDLLGVTEELSDRALADVLYQHRSGLRVLLAPHHGERAEEVTTARARLVLASLATRFDAVVVDAGSRVDEATSAAVEMADAVVLVATPDLAALSGVRRGVGAWERLGVLPGRGLSVVLSRRSRSSDVQHATAARLVTVPLAASSVGEDPARLQEAVNRRDPSLVPRRFTEDVAALAGELGLGGREGDAGAGTTVGATSPRRAPRRRRGSRRTAPAPADDLAALVAAPSATVRPGAGHRADGAPPPQVVPTPPAAPPAPTTSPGGTSVDAGAGQGGRPAAAPVAHAARPAAAPVALAARPATAPVALAVAASPASLAAAGDPGAHAVHHPGDAHAAHATGPAGDAELTPLERRTGLHRDSGQAALEFVGILPLLLLVVLVVWQGVVIGVTWSLAGHAATEGARAAAVGSDPGAAARADLPRAWREGAAVTGGVDGVQVVLQTPVLLPGSADLGLPITVTSTPVSEL